MLLPPAQVSGVVAQLITQYENSSMPESGIPVRVAEDPMRDLLTAMPAFQCIEHVAREALTDGIILVCRMRGLCERWRIMCSNDSLPPLFRYGSD